MTQKNGIWCYLNTINISWGWIWAEHLLNCSTAEFLLFGELNNELPKPSKWKNNELLGWTNVESWILHRQYFRAAVGLLLTCIGFADELIHGARRDFQWMCSWWYWCSWCASNKFTWNITSAQSWEKHAKNADIFHNQLQLDTFLSVSIWVWADDVVMLHPLNVIKYVSQAELKGQRTFFYCLIVL